MVLRRPRPDRQHPGVIWRKRERFTDYMTEVGQVGNQSARLGQELATTLTTPALKLEDLDATLGGYVQSAENQVAQAQHIDAPAPLYNAQLGLIEAHAVFTCYPLLIAALSGPILGEKVGWRRWTAGGWRCWRCRRRRFGRRWCGRATR